MKHAIFIPVRLSSSRLPEKALIDLHGRPMLAHLIERLKLSKKSDRMVVCTTTEVGDDPIAHLAKECGVDCFRGSLDDLLQRLCDAAVETGSENLLCVDGDDVMMDPDQVDMIAAYLDAHDVDFVRLSGLPFGANPIGLRTAALKKVCETKGSTDTATGWGVYFEEADTFRVESLVPEDADLLRSDVRVTLDYPEDLAFITKLFDTLYDGVHPIRIREVIELVDQQPDLLKINAGLKEKYWKHVAENQAGA